MEAAATGRKEFDEDYTWRVIQVLAVRGVAA
jgi:hypothetical protein